MAGDLRAAVTEHAERGVDVVKVMASGGFATPETDQLGAQFTVPELVALVDAAHRAGLPVVAHAHSLVGMQNALAAGVDGIEHFTGLSSAAGAQIDDDLLDEVARRGVVVDLTTGNDRSLHALMPAPPPAVAALMARFGVASFDEFYATRIGLFTRLREHGVAVVTGVDSGMGPAKRHGNAWRAVGEMVDAGYPAAEALADCDIIGRRRVRARRRDRPAGGGVHRRHPHRGRRPLLRHLGAEQPAGGPHPRDAGGARLKLTEGVRRVYCGPRSVLRQLPVRWSEVHPLLLRRLPVDHQPTQDCYAVFSYELAPATSAAKISIRPGNSQEWEAMIIRSCQQRRMSSNRHIKRDQGPLGFVR